LHVDPYIRQNLNSSLEDRASTPGDSPWYSTGQSFASSNADALSSSGAKLAGAIDVKAIEDNLSGWAGSSKVLMEMLDEVAKVHVFIGGTSKWGGVNNGNTHRSLLILVAVLSFKAVVVLEMKRRENDKKVIALQMQMQQMLVALLQ
jgi:hypothetical protein